MSTETLSTTTPYDLLMVETRDALGNSVTTVGSMTTACLQPRCVTDPNGNRSEVAFDTLGLVVGTAVMGKATETLGDSLDAAFEPDLTQTQLDAFMANHATRQPNANESTATRLSTTCWARRPRVSSMTSIASTVGQPPFAATLARETHVSDLPRRADQDPDQLLLLRRLRPRDPEEDSKAEPGPVDRRRPD